MRSSSHYIRWTCSMLALPFLVCGCGHPVQRQLEGRWLGDSVENIRDEFVAGATGWARGMSIEFAGSDITVSIPAEEPRTGRYKVVAVRQSRVDLSVLRDDGADSLKLRLDDQDSIRWMLDDVRAIVLRRQ